MFNWNAVVKADERRQTPTTPLGRTEPVGENGAGLVEQLNRPANPEVHKALNAAALNRRFN